MILVGVNLLCREGNDLGKLSEAGSNPLTLTILPAITRRLECLESSEERNIIDLEIDDLGIAHNLMPESTCHVIFFLGACVTHPYRRFVSLNVGCGLQR